MDMDKAIRENAVATYLGLVENIDGATLTRPYGIRLVRGPGNFSFCNFAAGFDFAADDADRVVDLLLENAQDSRGFCVFCSSADSSIGMLDKLMASGFSPRQSLVGMVSTGGPEGEVAEVVEQTERGQRLLVCQFMAMVFFGWMSRDARDAIALATALSRHSILSVGPVEDPDGAVMMVASENIFGLYNLCVKAEARGKGLGSSIVMAVQALAGKNDSPVGILCERSLVSWYQWQRFEPVGSIDVYCCDT